MSNNRNTQAPLYVVGIKPIGNFEIKDLFTSTEGGISDLIHKPPYLRYTGWNLSTGLNEWPRIRKGEFLEQKNGTRKTMRFYRNGTFIVLGKADSSFLGWGRGEEEFEKNPLVNCLAIIEFTYEIFAFYKEIVKHIPSFEKFSVSMNLSPVTVPSGKKIMISKDHVGSPFYGSSFDSHEISDDVEFSKEYSSSELQNPERLAFDLIEKIYNCASFTSDNIPYTKIVEGVGRVIDIDKINPTK